ncbi:bacteriophage protein [Gluconacetobacter johannae DSM 13595]|uniref:Phage baseplate assembly protein n=1 Tax=Gluconacetobacter johannae TaxID=112140 RepID=A0A7W4J8Y9_9PROT|nr:phage baseplate assembly protein [Gluconacetobacter johannae]MBB2176781.1 phage baseplate assembly protein [Gluconacetobacter johannae]GBQ84058.1 bacteriophage protein [Gluconacetobacter johannae DSM 13595]
MTAPILRVARRVAMAIGIGRQTANTDESRTTATVQVALPGGELHSDVPMVQLYGFASRPVPGSDLIVLFQGGDRSRGVAIASGDQRNRPTDLQPGEACLFHPASGNRVWMKADGSIAHNAPVVESSDVLRAGNGATGSFTTPTGLTVTVRDGIITNIY